MRDKFVLLRHQIAYDVRNGIKLQYKKFLFFVLIIVFLFLLFNRKVSDCILIPEGNHAGFWDYFVYLFRGKEKIGSLSHVDIFDIPIEWMLIHGYVLFAIGTYPNEEYGERGYQFFLKAGNKWCWWVSKGIYIISAVFLYYFSIVAVAFGFSAVQGTGFRDVNKEICNYAAGINVSDLSKSDIIWGVCIMPLLLLIALCTVELCISFWVGSMGSVIILLGYLSASAYWCNEWLLGNYTMLLRAKEVSRSVGVLILSGGILIFFVLGYFYFKQMDVISKQKEEIS